MIHYQLQCSASHGFDGWFKDSASFETQARRGLLECPVCGDLKVERALMTPAVPKKGRTRRVEPKEVVERAAPETANKPAEPAQLALAEQSIPDHIRAMLQKLRTEVEKNCDYVGNDFAAEARRIHRGESDTRGIYGETTADDAEALADEGIEIAAIPWVPRADS